MNRKVSRRKQIRKERAITRRDLKEFTILHKSQQDTEQLEESLRKVKS